jgi:YD repeat-containing protein
MSLSLAAFFTHPATPSIESTVLRAAPFALLLAIVLPINMASGQVSPGYPSFSAYDSHEVDTIDLLSNNIVLHAPIMSKSGAFPFRYSMVGGSYAMNSGSGSSWTVVSGAGGTIIAPFYQFAGFTYSNSGTCTDGSGTLIYSGYYIMDQQGTYHYLPPTDYTDSAGCLKASFTDQTLDGSYTLSSTEGSINSVYTTNGMQIFGNTGGTAPASYFATDSNGNSIKQSYNAGSYTVTDTMGLAPIQFSSSGTTWNDVNGGTQTFSTSAVSTHWYTNFGCPDISETNELEQQVNSLSWPDGTSLGFTYEKTPGSSTYTGRLASLTLREGGIIQYQYSGGNNGIDCTYQSVPKLTRTTNDGTTTYTLTHTTIGSGIYNATNAVVDNGGNQTIYTFTGFTSTGAAGLPTGQVLTEVQRYQGVSTLLTTDVYCYNTVFSSCSFTGGPNAVVTLPISSLVVMHKINGLSNTSATETHFDSYGNVTYSAQYDFGGISPIRATTIQYGSCSATCAGSSPTISAVGSHVNNKPGRVYTQAVATSGEPTIADSRYTYDSKGDLLTTYAWNGSAFLSNSTANVYNANGTISKSFDLANNENDYTYSPTGYYVYSDGTFSSCSACTNYPFPTKITNVGTGLSTSATWEATGGVKLTDVDANKNTTNYCYTSGTGCSGGTADPFWRPLSITDPLGNVAYKTYPNGTSPNTVNGSFTFNSGSSIQNTTIVSDAYGRTINGQTQQSPSATNYDTVSKVYAWSAPYRTVATSQPCSTASGGTCTTVHTSSFDPLGRLVTETTTNNETLTHAYTQNDDLMQLAPAPSGEHVKETQNQYDGLGRLTLSCAIGNGSTTACSQNSGSLDGVTTSYAYTYASGSSTTSATRGSQTRTTIMDAMGRVIQRKTPEGGTWTFYYDSDTSCPSGYRGANGRLAASLDPNGNLICYAYDSLGRTTAVNANGTACRYYYYDSSTGYNTSIPTQVSAPVNPLGHIVEAATDDCAATHTTGTLITDEWFSYDKDGRTTDMWELTPHSGQYYHSTATFFGNGKVNTIQLVSPSLYTLTYGLDGEGRWNTLTDTTTSQPLVAGATFPPAATCSGSPCSVVTLTGTDNDVYTFAPNTGHMNQYVFTVGSGSMTGSLTWNANRTVNQLAITDGFNSGGTQTCNFNSIAAAGTGYDDWGRLLGVDCGSGQWGQTFSYDNYDNLSKAVISGRTGTSWNPGYSPTTSQCLICTYDSDGDVTGDSNNVYGWNQFAKIAWTATSGGPPTCGSSGRCLTYDAFSRIVEQSNGGAFIERWITQLGETAYMSGATPDYAYWPAPGGRGKVVIVGTTSYDYTHSDWLGNARLTSGITTHTVGTDQAYSPYGEIYDLFSSNAGEFKSFAGLTGDFDPTLTTPVMWDTPNRELSMVGRWLSPDPAGAGWNQYAYPTNPNNANDPTGLNCVVANLNSGGVGCQPGWGGGGSGGGIGGDMGGVGVGEASCWFNAECDGLPEGTVTSSWSVTGIENSTAGGTVGADQSQLGYVAPLSPFNLPASAFSSDGLSSILGIPTGTGDPAGIAIVGLSFQYDGPNGYYDAGGDQHFIFGDQPFDATDVFNVWSEQVVDASQQPLAGTFTITQNVVNIPAKTTPGAADIYPDASWSTNYTGGFIDQIGFVNPAGTQYMTNVQNYYVNGSQVNSLFQGAMYYNGNLVFGMPWYTNGSP